MDFWSGLFSADGFMARRYCGLNWDGGLVKLHVVSDVIIWLSYLWIPLVMLTYYRIHRRQLRVPVPLGAILILYVVFITACGWTHFFDALMFYVPAYRVNGLVRALTAAASFLTAVSLLRLVPQAITAPITILTQKAALKQQQDWLRDILDSVTDGVLRLCDGEGDLPAPLPGEGTSVVVAQKTDLRAVRRMLTGVAADAGLSPDRTGDLLSAAHEAAMNALVHAGGATVRAFAQPDGGRVQVWVEDAGGGIPLDRLPISTLKQGFSTAGTAGQGWFLLLTFADCVWLLTGPAGTRVVLEMGGESAKTPRLPFSAAVGGDVPPGYGGQNSGPAAPEKAPGSAPPKGRFPLTGGEQAA